MATQLGGQFSLYYIFYDWDGPESDVHRQEVERFNQMVGEEARLKAKPYQEVFAYLNELDGVDTDYMHYLKNRYFTDGY